MIWTNLQGDVIAVPNIRHLSNIRSIDNNHHFTITLDSDYEDNGISCYYKTFKEAEVQLKQLTKLLEEYHGFLGTFIINDYVLVMPFIKYITSLKTSLDSSEFIVYFIGRTSVYIKGSNDSVYRRYTQLIQCLGNFWGQKAKTKKTIKNI